MLSFFGKMDTFLGHFTEKSRVVRVGLGSRANVEVEMRLVAFLVILQMAVKYIMDKLTPKKLTGLVCRPHV